MRIRMMVGSSDLTYLCVCMCVGGCASVCFLLGLQVATYKTLLTELAKLTDFSHTGAVEVYHSNQLVWTPK